MLTIGLNRAVTLIAEKLLKGPERAAVRRRSRQERSASIRRKAARSSPRTAATAPMSAMTASTPRCRATRRRKRSRSTRRSRSSMRAPRPAPRSAAHRPAKPPRRRRRGFRCSAGRSPAEPQGGGEETFPAKRFHLRARKPRARRLRGPQRSGPPIDGLTDGDRPWRNPAAASQKASLPGGSRRLHRRPAGESRTTRDRPGLRPQEGPRSLGAQGACSASLPTMARSRGGATSCITPAPCPRCCSPTSPGATPTAS